MFSSYGHTVTPTPVYAVGKNAGYFEGSLDNTQVARILGSFIEK